MNLIRDLRKSCVAGLLVLALPGTVLAQTGAGAEQAASRVDGSLPGTAQPGASAARLLPAPVSKEYRIGVDDILSVNVWHETDLSRNVTVRPDGKISLPLIGEVRAAGKTPTALQGELQSDLAQFIKDPQLTVIVAEIRSRRINVIGQVMHPGTFSLTQQMGVLDAIALAGGLREFAKKNKIYVLRETAAGRRVRLEYKYRDILRGKGNAQDILLEPHDTVVVP